MTLSPDNSCFPLVSAPIRLRAHGIKWNYTVGVPSYTMGDSQYTLNFVRKAVLSLVKRTPSGRGTGAGGGIRTHEPLRDGSLSPTPLTRLGDPRTVRRPPLGILKTLCGRRLLLPWRPGRDCAGVAQPGRALHIWAQTPRKRGVLGSMPNAGFQTIQRKCWIVSTTSRSGRLPLQDASPVLGRAT